LSQTPVIGCLSVGQYVNFHCHAGTHLFEKSFSLFRSASAFIVSGGVGFSPAAASCIQLELSVIPISMSSSNSSVITTFFNF
jgi:hypothetical protein